MSVKKHQYDGKNVIVSYDLGRCIHAGECVRGLPHVFDPGRKPWIQPDRADVDELLRVVDRCPTGALQAERKDGGDPLPAASANSVTVDPNGPLLLRGDLRFTTPGGEQATDTRLALCRCGASKNKPYCDNSHKEAGFHDAGELGTFKAEAPAKKGPLAISFAKNGPVLTSGQLEIRGSDGREPVQCERSALCRCGASRNKPFCDGAHKTAGFEAG